MAHPDMQKIIMLSARVGTLGNKPSARMEAQVLRAEIQWMIQKVIRDTQGG